MPSLATIAQCSALLLPTLVSAVGTLGFSIGITRTDGSCKSTDDLIHDLKIIKAGTGSNVVRTYSTSTGADGSGCPTADLLLPALAATGSKAILGVWPVGYFDAEVDALSKAIQAHGGSQIEGVTVGSEALYRNYLSASDLGNEINRVRSVLQGMGVKCPVGFADSWNKIVDGTADPALAASDLVLANAFSYWQAQHIDNATHSFFDDIMQALGHVQRVKPGAFFWVGETNWPTGGQPYEDISVPSTENAATYWKDAICGMRDWDIDVFVFEAFDEPQKPLEKGNDVERHWGVFDSNGQPKFTLSC